MKWISRNIKDINEYVINVFTVFVLHLCFNAEFITYLLISWIHFFSVIWNVIFIINVDKNTDFYQSLILSTIWHQVFPCLSLTIDDFSPFFNVIIWRLGNNIRHRHESCSLASYKTSSNLTSWQNINILRIF